MLLRLLRVRPGEAGRVFPMFALLGLIIATSYVLKPVRSALFLSQFGAERLPYVYILIAIVLGFVAALFARFTPRMSVSRLFAGLALFFSANLLVFWLLLRAEWKWTGFSFYVWVSIFTALLPSLFWLLANYVFYANEGRRLFPLVMAGGLLGSILGGAGTSLVVRRVGTPGLLLGAAGLLFLIAFVVWLVARRESQRMNERRSDVAREERSRASSKDEHPFRTIARSRYLSLLTGLVLLTGVTSTLVDFQFNAVVEHAFETRDDLTAFFGGFFALINVLAFFAQLVLAGRLLSWLGVGAGLLALPLGLGLSSLSFVLYPSLFTAALLKGADDGMSNSLNRASVEVLYLPVALSIKNRLKAWIDMFVERVSRGLSGVIILGATTFLSFDVRELSLAVLALLIPWFGLVVLLRKEYVETFKRSLARRDLKDLSSTLNDPASLDVFRQILASGDEKGTLYALELLSGTDDSVLLEEMTRLASHPNPLIRRAALGALRSANQPPALDDIAQRVADEDTDVAAEALALWIRLQPARGNEGLAALVRQGDVERTTAFLERIEDSEGLLPTDVLEGIVSAHGESESVPGRKLAAKAIRFLPSSPEVERRLVTLLWDRDIDVARAAASSASRHRSPAMFEELVRALARRPLRAPLRRSIARFERDAIEALERLASDGTIAAEIRVALPRAIAAFEDPRSVDALFRMLPDADLRFHYQGIKSLARLRSRAGTLRFPRAQVERLLGHEVELLRELLGHRDALAGTDERKGAHRLLVEVLQERVDFARERVFRLLGLVYEQDEMAGLFLRVMSGRPAVRAEALEYLGNLFTIEHRMTLLPVIERDSLGRRRSDGLEHPLGALARVEDPWLAACAIATIGELGLHSLVPVLQTARAGKNDLIREVSERSLQSLAAASR